jgi:hypothetical protein
MGASKSTFAQDLDNASITGRVIDQNRAVITNATDYGYPESNQDSAEL